MHSTVLISVSLAQAKHQLTLRTTVIELILIAGRDGQVE